MTSVPHIIILKGGKKVGEYKGSKKEELQAALAAAA